MCGICGLYHFQSDRRADPATVQAMARAISHRGPDDEGFLVRGNGVCRGRSLVHANHLRSIHEVVQLRLNNSHFDQRPSLYHLYDMMHAMSVFLQLEVRFISF